MSDIITVHTYSDLDTSRNMVKDLKTKYGRPVIVSEYMARPVGSKF